MVGHSYDIAVADYVSVVILSLRLLDVVSCDETKWSFVPDLWFRPFYVTNASPANWEASIPDQEGLLLACTCTFSSSRQS